MRQRKATAYPQVGALVQPRPGDGHLSTARHAMRMAPKASGVKQREPEFPRRIVGRPEGRDSNGGLLEARWFHTRRQSSTDRPLTSDFRKSFDE